MIVPKSSHDRQFSKESSQLAKSTIINHFWVWFLAGEREKMQDEKQREKERKHAAVENCVQFTESQITQSTLEQEARCTSLPTLTPNRCEDFLQTAYWFERQHLCCLATHWQIEIEHIGPDAAFRFESDPDFEKWCSSAPHGTTKQKTTTTKHKTRM